MKIIIKSNNKMDSLPFVNYFGMVCFQQVALVLVQLALVWPHPHFLA